MRNMNSVISSHNRFWLGPTKTEFGFNRSHKTDCPLQNKCWTSSIVCQADVTNNADNERRVYLAVSETPFKDRYGNHFKEGKHKKYY